jgi:hypothetical protein
MACRSFAIFLLLLTSCYSKGPYYAISQVEPIDGHVNVVVDEYRRRHYVIGRSPERDGGRHFVAPLHDTTGTVTLGPARRLLYDGMGEQTRFVPVPGSQAHVGVTEKYWTTMTLTLVRPSAQDGKSPERTIARIRRNAQAAAVARSASHYLLVGPNEFLIAPLAGAGAVVERSTDHPLLRMRAEIVRRFGLTGRWWLTDDLRYVVIEPPDAELDAALALPKEERKSIFGNDPEFPTYGLIFDRQTGMISTYPIRIEDFGQIVDVESIEGELFILYSTRSMFVNGSSLTIVRAATGEIRSHAEIKKGRGDEVIDMAWEPAAGRVHVLVGEASPQANDISSPAWISGWWLHTWHCPTGTVERTWLSKNLLAPAVSAAR